MRWITSVEYKPEQRVQSLKEAEALAALLFRGNHVIEVPPPHGTTSKR